MDQFQTPPVVCDYMASLMLPEFCGFILEPTPGIGNLVKALNPKGIVITFPTFEAAYSEFLVTNKKYDWVVMNPPFTPMSEGWRYLTTVTEMSDNIIALLPYLILINSDIRLKFLFDYGFESLTSLPRKTFPGSRIQSCIIKLQRGYSDSTIFKRFSW